jgi:NAD(P)-dependent dehydrogenase (short-subunit alcohol dehydrogenase family)
MVDLAGCRLRRRLPSGEAVTTGLDAFGAIDELACKAGVSLDTGPLVEATDAAFRATMDINVRAVLHLSNLVIRQMAC